MNKNIKMLIVDDEVRFLQTLTQRLTLRGFDVVAATNGAEALELARQQEFDLALVDLKMPGMSGEDVLVRLKKAHPYLEVIILTGHGSIDSAVNCTRAGSYTYLQKPCETEDLLEVLKEAYHKRIRNMLRIYQERVDELMRASAGESALSILRRLKDLEEKLR